MRVYTVHTGCGAKDPWFVEKLDWDIGARISCNCTSLEERFGAFVNIRISSAPPVKVLAPFFLLMAFDLLPCDVNG